eukprot:GHUV01010877.1.p1 GENE.GHUV01010877.1~~GHUV01010877.1.p1  ORF type:complete len:291 (+),score=87.41 GHUV01010877.1:788-1660(+)
MASRFQEEPITERTECENCGATEGLLRCSRCHAAWFCSLKCHKAYWPFHKSSCKRNDFADAIEQQEPKFAAWMRKHGKLAVVQDDEVDRIERSSKPGGWRGLHRQEVLESMYGKMDPSPAAPKYDPMPIQQATEQQPAVAANNIPARDEPWDSLVIPEGTGLSSTGYKWRQNLSHVEVFVKLPATITPKQVTVCLSPTRLTVTAAGDELLGGRLSAEVKVEDSTWYCDDGILYIQLLKRNRKGHYSNGSTAADTFWFSLMKAAVGNNRLPGSHPPNRYYSMPYEADDLEE